MLANKIHAEIAAQGPISFARFMELALYCPDCGFYERETDTVGRRGHFQTSVTTGNLFGQLLAFQFKDWIQSSKASYIQLVESGAHDGRLAADILSWFRASTPTLLDSLQYIIVEPSARRRSWQERTLTDFTQNVRWLDSFSRETPDDSDDTPFRIIFSNELLDAMPVYRLGWDAEARSWFEWRVTSQSESFAWAKASPTPELFTRIPHLAPRELTDVLPHDYTIEVSPAAESWWRVAATFLRRGKLIAFDYGLTNDELFAPQRIAGTIRSYHRHRHADDVLATPGEQDITAHVNFSEVRSVGELAGLLTEAFSTQSQFLTNIARRTWQQPSAFGDWSPAMTRQFQSLTHPDHLGRAFKVLVQSR